MEYPKKQKRYLTLDIVRGFAALSVLLTHWGGWTIAYADDATTQIIVLYQKALQLVFWAGGGTPWGYRFYCS